MVQGAVRWPGKDAADKVNRGLDWSKKFPTVTDATYTLVGGAVIEDQAFDPVKKIAKISISGGVNGSTAEFKCVATSPEETINQTVYLPIAAA